MKLSKLTTAWLFVGIASIITGACFTGIFSSADPVADYSTGKYIFSVIVGVSALFLLILPIDKPEFNKLKALVVIIIILSQIPIVIECISKNGVALKLHDNYGKPDEFFTFKWYYSLPSIMIMTLSLVISVFHFKRTCVKQE